MLAVFESRFEKVQALDENEWGLCADDGETLVWMIENKFQYKPTKYEGCV